MTPFGLDPTTLLVLSGFRNKQKSTSAGGQIGGGLALSSLPGVAVLDPASMYRMMSFQPLRNTLA